jgi:hypothetical protein
MVNAAERHFKQRFVAIASFLDPQNPSYSSHPAHSPNPVVNWIYAGGAGGGAPVEVPCFVFGGGGRNNGM